MVLFIHSHFHRTSDLFLLYLSHYTSYFSLISLFSSYITQDAGLIRDLGCQLVFLCRLPDDMVTDGECSGIGCCQVDVPSEMKNITIQAYRFGSSSRFSDCGFSFVAKKGSYKFSVSHLEDLPFTMLPMVIDWSVGNESCEFFERGGKSACMKNSYCDDGETSYGYRCRCETGYDGNPYHPNGCQGILMINLCPCFKFV